MAWGRIDDRMYSHRKTMRIPRVHRCAAIGLWSLANSWCNNHGTGGRVPRDIWDEFGTTQEIADLLVEAGYWVVVEDGYEFVNWGEFNLTTDDLQARREAEAERKRRWRESKRRSSEGCPTDVPAGQRDMSQDVPAESDDVPPSSALTHTQSHTQKNSSTKSSSSPTKTNEPPREDVEALCSRLRDRMIENGCKPPTITRKWRTDARLLLDADGRDLDKALNLIDWCQHHSFWKSVIRSMPKFREKYDTIRMQAVEEHNKNRGAPNGSELTSRERKFLKSELLKDNPNPQVLRAAGIDPTTHMKELSQGDSE